jgi:predicted HAD superfamily phosphohydrolase YqeG
MFVQNSQHLHFMNDEAARILVACNGPQAQVRTHSSESLVPAVFQVLKPFCRQASNTVTATAFDKFRLR